MFKIQVWYDRHWKEGIRFYDSIEAVNARIAELNKVGIKARLMPPECY